MKTRRLGRDGPAVSAIGLGCMGLSEAYGPVDAAEAEATLAEAAEQGITLFNTSDAYGDGANEELIARVLGSRRDAILLNTKFGTIRDAGGIAGVDGRPEHVAASCEASLTRLRTDRIDIYTQHRVDPDVPIEETVGALKRLIDAGKVRFIGLSEAGPRTIRRAHTVHPLSVIESEYSLWTRDVEAEVLPTCRELGIALMPYAPLGRGFLTGEIKSARALAADDRRHGQPRFADENISRNIGQLEALEDIAFQAGFKPAHMALAWLLHRGDDIVPIPGTKRRKYLRENLRAADVELPPKILEKVNRLFAAGSVSGARYSDKQLAQVGI